MIDQRRAQPGPQAPGRLSQRKTGHLAELFGAKNAILSFTGCFEWDLKVGSKGERSPFGTVPCSGKHAQIGLSPGGDNRSFRSRNA